MNILVLAPHTDDGELGCGASIAKFIAEGNKVYYATFSVCEESVPGGLPRDTLEREVVAATAMLGILPEDLIIFRFPVRRFHESRQEILNSMIDIREKIKPDLVFMPCKNDVHQDHSLLSTEGIRAFKQSSILTYEMVWNNLSMSTMAFIKVDKKHLDLKVEALKMYTSQQGIRQYMNREFVESLARVRGVQAGSEFAEAFEVVRWII